ncbi:MAG: hypothetical protein HOM34_05245 [Planctomycetes bacterium]|nr:hypothetical protein [Planctomycetota bacterium]MBT4028824.1 hypothetical protein [Planctomycetota bacterium]MBT4559616.1 hypothetical protein [Planctomycetota bacterium]MBT5100554.1 hypothetical protein [Planctomycetota bacterium]MBT5120110.1 hypothetical protein [Planctomycetota bacterium]
MSDSDFFSFENALDQLELEADDLKRLISAGEIRAFREGSKMRLRTEDVQRVAGELGIETVTEAESGEVLEVEEVLFTEAAEDDGMVTTQLSEEDTLLDSALEELEVEPEAPAASATVKSSATATKRGAASRSRVQESEEAAVDSPAMIGVSILTTLLLIFLGIPAALGMAESRGSGMIQSIVDMVWSAN